MRLSRSFGSTNVLHLLRARGALSFVLVTAALDALAGSLAGPVMPRLMLDLSASPFRGGEATLYGLYLGIFAVMQMISAPIQAALSDRFGRRPVILLSSFGLMIGFAVIALAHAWWVLLVAQILNGAMAGNISASFAYVADISSDADRTRRFGVLNVVICVGVMLGPLLGGLLGEAAVRLPFWVAAALCGANTLWGWRVLQESLPSSSRAPIRHRDLFPVTALCGLWRRHPRLLPWAFATFAVAMAYRGMSSVFPIYVTYRFAWSPSTIGLYGGAMACINIVVQLGVAARLVARFGELKSICLGLGLQTIGMVAASLAASGLGFAVSMAFLMVGMFADPAQLALTSRLVPPEEQGRLAGATRLLSGCAGVTAPLIYASAFAPTRGSGTGSGAAFAMSAAFLALSLAVAVSIMRAKDSSLEGSRASIMPSRRRLLRFAR